MDERMRDQLRRHPRLVAAGAVGLVVLAGVAGGLAIGVFGPQQPIAEASEAPTGQPVPSEPSTDGPSNIPTAAPGGPQITWSERTFDGLVNAVTFDSGQWVAVGRTPAGLAAWTSPDSVTWGLHPVPQPRPDQILPSFPGDQSSFLGLLGMGPLARLDDTLYSFGTFGNFIDFIRPLGWRSVDGTQWEYIDSENEFFSYGAILDLTASDTSLLAAKSRPYAATSAWLWTPDTSWTQTGLASSRELSITILDLAWSESGFIAVGVSAESDPSTDPQEWPASAASWVSLDGKTWEAAPSSSGLEMAIMWAITPMPEGGFVAVGCAGCSQGHPGGAGYGDPAAWTSPDGVNWTQVLLPSDAKGEALGVVSVDNGFVAAGVVGEDTVIWTSNDGRTWRAGPTMPGRFQSKTLAVRDDAVLFTLTRGEQAGSIEAVLVLGRIQR